MICGGCDCIYRGFLSSGTSASDSYCDKLCMTGHSTLKWFYDEHHIDHLDDHWRKVLAETECPFYKRSSSAEKRAARRNRSAIQKLDERKAKELYKAGCSDYKIARLLNVTTSRIKLWRKHNGLPSQYALTYKTRLEFDPDEAKRLYKEGLPDKVIAERLGCSTKKIGNWRRERGLLPNKQRLKKYDWELAFTLYAEGKSDADISKALRCSPSAVWNWKQRNGLV